MSNLNNDNLLDRASDLLEELSGHPSHLDTALSQAITNGDLEEVKYLVNKLEALLAQEHFKNYEVV